MTITDLAIAFGSADNGGGVDNAGNLTLQRDSVTGNAANMSGGGIFNTGTLEVDDSTISAGQAHILGGGIASDIGSTATLVRDAITGNTVFGSGIYGAGGAGIGEYGATLSVRDSTITGNVLKNTGVGGGITAIFGFPRRRSSATQSPLTRRRPAEGSLSRRQTTLASPLAPSSPATRVAIALTP